MNEITVAVTTGTQVSTFDVNTLTDKQLREQTQAINSLMTETKKSMLEIAVRLMTVDVNKLYVKDGFKNVVDYGEKVLNYKKAFTYQLLNTARRFIEQNTRGGYQSVIAHNDNDYTVSQLQELNSIKPQLTDDINTPHGVEDADHKADVKKKVSSEIEDSMKRKVAVSLDEHNVINPSMSATEIRKVVKAYNSGKIDENGNELETEEDNVSRETEEQESEQVDALAVALLDIANGIDVALSDERITKNEELRKQFEQFKQTVENIQF